jgi:hypothetical protein
MSPESLPITAFLFVTGASVKAASCFGDRAPYWLIELDEQGMLGILAVYASVADVEVTDHCERHLFRCNVFKAPSQSVYGPE